MTQVSTRFTQISKIGFTPSIGHFVVLEDSETRHPIAEGDYRKISAWADGTAVDDETVWLGMPEDVFDDMAEYVMSTGWAG